MKIEIRGNPVFNINFSLALLNSLKECSRLHYDGACRQLSQEAVGGFENGLITQMISMAEFMKADGETREVSWRELDLLLKVCEGYQMIIDDFEQLIVLVDFVTSANKAFKEATRALVGWRTSV